MGLDCEGEHDCKEDTQLEEDGFCLQAAQAHIDPLQAGNLRSTGCFNQTKMSKSKINGAYLEDDIRGLTLHPTQHF